MRLSSVRDGLYSPKCPMTWEGLPRIQENGQPPRPFSRQCLKGAFCELRHHGFLKPSPRRPAPLALQWGAMLGQALREARHPKGWNIEQLSKSSGVPGGLIREIENQSPSYVPSENNTILLGEALRIPVGLLLGHRERLFERWRPRGSNAAGSEELSA